MTVCGSRVAWSRRSSAAWLWDVSTVDDKAGACQVMSAWQTVDIAAWCHWRQRVWLQLSTPARCVPCCIDLGTFSRMSDYSCVWTVYTVSQLNTHPFNGPLSGTTRVSWYQKGKTNLKQETTSGSGISWAACKSARCSEQITTPAPHHSVFYTPDALPAT